MFHHKIDVAAVAQPSFEIIEDAQPQLDTAARLWSVAIIAALPLIALWALAQWLWSDVKAAGRALRHFHRGAAEELSRPS